MHGRIARAQSVRQQVRSWQDWKELQQIDLQIMREFRRKNALMVVVGAGAMMAAGGPSWAGVVRELLTRAFHPEKAR